MSAGRRLTVTAADEGTGKRAGLAPETLAALDAAAGDVLAVEGTRSTPVAAVAAEAVDPDAVALGETARRNAGADVGESVTVEPIAAALAERVTLAPVNDLSLRGGADALGRVLSDLPLATGDRVRASLFSDALRLPFVVVETEPEGVVRVGEGTALSVREEPASDLDTAPDRRRRVRLADLGGVAEPADLLADLLVRPLTDPERYETLGRRPASGVLLHGPGGVGKTHLIHALATEADASLVSLHGPRLAGLSADEATDSLESAVERARRAAPAIVHLEEVEAAAPADAAGGDRRTVAALVDLVERLADQPRVAVVGESRHPEDVAERLRRGGRLEREVDLPAPGREGRREILDVFARTMRLDDVDLGAVAARTHGFVAADLAALCREAVLRAVRRERRSVPDAESTRPLAVTDADFAAADDAVEPSAMRGFRVSVPSVSYDDVGGLEAAKRELERAVEWPLRHPELFEQYGTTPSRGILLYGPPGTGKTLLAQAVASATDANFISVDGPELLDKYVGESERAVRQVFAAARQNAPSVVFFDEVDAITTVRGDDDAGGGSRAPERVVSQLLTEIDGIERLDSVTVVGATNRPDRIDPALLRPGRLERVVEVPLPDRTARREILAVHTRDVPVGDVDLGAVADRTEGYTGSDLEALVREAALAAIERRLRTVGRDGDASVETDHFDAALETVRPSVTGDQREYYERVGDRLGR
jgi:transitional endoplasmic reticulum ATPase